MDNPNSIMIPELDDDLVQSLAAELGLSELDSSRSEFVRNTTSLDIAACPGSGKTTLVVLKFIALTRRWSKEGSGICVLSHTNVAKDEITSRLNNLGEAINIDGRPHFVGTIDNFLNRFLATPYLASLECTPSTIDTDTVLSRRKTLLPANIIRGSLSKRQDIDSILQAKVASTINPCGELLGSGKKTIGKDTKTYKEVSSAIRSSMSQGQFTYDEILLFAKNCLEENPAIARAVSRRFPFVIVDEAQDTNVLRSEILKLIFDGRSVVQRIGDPNQRLGDKDFDQSFPQPNHHSISDSFRFGQSIADAANGLAVEKVIPNGLIGRRAGGKHDSSRFVILFDPEHECGKVLTTFGCICSKHLPENELKNGKIAAVGGRHSDEREEKERRDPKSCKKPYSVLDYMPNYRPKRKTGSKVRLADLQDYWIQSRTIIQQSGQLADGVNVLSSGILSALGLRATARPYLKLKEAVAGSDEANKMLDLIECACKPEIPHMRDDFMRLRSAILDVKQVLVDQEKLGRQTPYQDKFLNYYDETREARFTYQDKDGESDYLADGVRIELGSIHSVKGETHVATLLLETFMRAHKLKDVIKYISGTAELSKGKISDSTKARMREAYVALSRPTTLVAIALPFQSLGVENLNDALTHVEIVTLENDGWHIVSASDY